jgi:hypothetical protein
MKLNEEKINREQAVGKINRESSWDWEKNIKWS